MKKGVLHMAERHPAWAVLCGIAVSVLYLLLVVFTGVDVCDTGFYLTFYQNILTSPETVEYNFMYYLSGLVGGVVQSVCPSMGLLGWKLLGVLTIALSQWLIYRMLRDVVPVWAIIVGNAMVVLAFAGMPVAFCNDLLTTLLYALALLLLYRGINDDRLWPLFFAGLVLGVNIFTRIPNVLACVLAFMPLLMRFGRGWQRAIKASGIAVLGVVAGVTAMLCLMEWLGHQWLFMSNLRDLRAIAGDESGGSTHSLWSMVGHYLTFYVRELVVVAAVATALFFSRASVRGTRTLTLLLCVAICAIVSIGHNSLDFLWAFSLVGCVYVLFTAVDRRLRLASLLSLAMMLLFPLGSDGAYNNGSIIALAAAPVAAGVWAERGRRQWLAVLLPWAVCCVLHMAVAGAYFDGGALWKKRAAVNHQRMTCVYTTPERAAVLNDVLPALQERVKAGDTMMVYGSMPLLNYLTETRPAMGCSWPELLSAPLLQRKLAKYDPPRWVLRQHFNTLGKDWKAPATDWQTHYRDESPFLDDNKLVVVNNFMERNAYREVWSNERFTLYELRDTVK